jgi:hypothetical protein
MRGHVTLTAEDLEESALRMHLRRELHAHFCSEEGPSTGPAWRWLGRVLRRGRQVVPADLGRQEIELALAEIAKLRAASSEARAA